MQLEFSTILVKVKMLIKVKMRLFTTAKKKKKQLFEKILNF